MFLDHTRRRSAVGRTPLDEWSARRRDLYLTTHDTHNRQISMPPVGFEPTISAGERPQASKWQMGFNSAFKGLINLEFSVQNFQKILKYRISWKPVKWKPSCFMRTEGQTCLKYPGSCFKLNTLCHRAYITYSRARCSPVEMWEVSNERKTAPIRMNTAYSPGGTRHSTSFVYWNRSHINNNNNNNNYNNNNYNTLRHGACFSTTTRPVKLLTICQFFTILRSRLNRHRAYSSFCIVEPVFWHAFVNYMDKQREPL